MRTIANAGRSLRSLTMTRLLMVPRVGNNDGRHGWNAKANPELGV